MVNLLKNKNLSKEELENLDSYFDFDKISELLNASDEDIIKYIEASEEVLGYSIAKMYFGNYLFSETIDLKCDFDISNLDYCNRILSLIKYFDFDDFGLAYAIGDYYLDKDKNEALKYYKMIFKPGFDLGYNGYYASLCNYLRLLNKNPSIELKELINGWENDNDFKIDYINTILLLIINLEKYSDEYIKYIELGIKVATPFIRENQSPNRQYFSDSDEERDLCELVALKLEHYVHKKDYVEAGNAYRQLTEEIGRSDCTRYYHARDRFYNEMIKSMRAEYPELSFFDDIGYDLLKITDENVELILNKEITLQNEAGLTFKFKILNVTEDTCLVAPIIPLFGEGKRILMKPIKDSDGLSLKSYYGF